MKIEFGVSFEFEYTNWRGETRLRHAIPLYLWRGTTQHHTKPAWLLHARDVNSGHLRDFSLSHITVASSVAYTSALAPQPPEATGHGKDGI